LALVLGTSANGIPFADGEIHVIDATNSLPLDYAEVDDSGSGAPTTFIVTTGGQVAGITVAGTSLVELTGGWVTGPIDASGNSSVAISSGDARELYARDDSSIVLSGGNADNLFISGGANADIAGILLNGRVVASGGFLSISDGIVTGFLNVNGAQHAEVSGDTLGGATIDSATEITGGLRISRISGPSPNVR
jgi:hypothetical protein